MPPSLALNAHACRQLHRLQRRQAAVKTVSRQLVRLGQVCSLAHPKQGQQQGLHLLLAQQAGQTHQWQRQEQDLASSQAQAVYPQAAGKTVQSAVQLQPQPQPPQRWQQQGMRSGRLPAAQAHQPLGPPQAARQPPPPRPPPPWVHPPPPQWGPHRGHWAPAQAACS